MSHEIRTPLGAILGFAELLQNANQSPADRLESTTAILRNGRHLLKIVNDLLDLSKVEAGHFDLERTALPLADFLQEVELFHRAKARAKGISLEFEVLGRIPSVVQTDPARLRQVLINLIGNAIKFTHAGQVKLSVRFEAASGAPYEGQLVFTISDTGIGISNEFKDRLFQPFMQGDSSTRRKFGGTGLGLALSRRLAILMGGDLTLLSSTPKGTTFELRIAVRPIDPANTIDRIGSKTVTLTPSPGRNDDSLGLKGLKVLLLEDVPDNFRLIKHFLEPAGVVLEWASDGKTGVEKALAGSFELILMDVQMPEMDGYQATAKLRQSGYSGPIIALTAHAMIEERARCLEAGCNEHLSKPLNRNLLLRTIQRVVKTVDESRPPAPLLDPEVAAIVRSFVSKTYPRLLAGLENAIEARSWEYVNRLALLLLKIKALPIPAEL